MNPFETSQRQVRSWRDQMTTVKAADMFQPPDHLPKLQVLEIDEAEAEHQLEGTLLYNFFDHAKELADVLVFLFSFCAKHGILPDFEAAWARANGQGSHSPIYDQLREKTLYLQSGNIERNVNDFLTYVISLSRHLPQPVDIVTVMDAVIKKNSANRDLKYYRGVDQFGRHLTPDQLVAKYHHVERMLKFLRRHYRATLEPWMHEPMADLILDYEHSEVAFGRLQQRLKQRDQKLVFDLETHLKQTTHPQADSQVLYALAKAGAVQLQFPAA